MRDEEIGIRIAEANLLHLTEVNFIELPELTDNDVCQIAQTYEQHKVFFER
jgi:hypothetical protein